ncbi:hypothetical protein [Marinobacter sp.]|uniref:hypothetical protein n=1 Tax=Marinobacter sp. TaxID=50741 RepID=UPI001B731FC3|nr:hypothetical protein [Marinobacter sp.]MBQ0831283.1 hypothetical protein [Marinobacter sp.]
MERVYALPAESKHFHLFTRDSDIKGHQAYSAGKSGDPDAALQLIEDLAFEFLRGLRGVFPAGTIFVSPYAKEATGDNALPLILSLMCAELLNGGEVLGTILLVNAGRSKEFRPANKHIQLLEERFGDEIKNIFGIHTRALTANEAGYLVGFRAVDEIRNRCTKAEKETRLRLLSKGY